MATRKKNSRPADTERRRALGPADDDLTPEEQRQWEIWGPAKDKQELRDELDPHDVSGIVDRILTLATRAERSNTDGDLAPGLAAIVRTATDLGTLGNKAQREDVKRRHKDALRAVSGLGGDNNYVALLDNLLMHVGGRFEEDGAALPLEDGVPLVQGVLRSLDLHAPDAAIEKAAIEAALRVYGRLPPGRPRRGHPRKHHASFEDRASVLEHLAAVLDISVPGDLDRRLREKRAETRAREDRLAPSLRVHTGKK